MNASKSVSLRRYQGGNLSTIIHPQQTRNQFALIEFQLPTGAEPPPHIHHMEDETFYVLEGRLSVTVGNETTILEAGAGLFAPRGIPHSFRILTSTARFLNLISPGNLWQYFMDFSSPLLPDEAVNHQPASLNLQQMIEIITRTYRVEFLPPAANSVSEV